MAYGFVGGRPSVLGKKRKRPPLPGYNEMTRVKRMAEVKTLREDLRQAEMRRNYLLELGNIRSEMYGKLSPGVQHPLHDRRNEVVNKVLETLK